MNTTIVISLIGVIAALISLSIALGRIVWLLSNKLSSIEADVVLIKEIHSIKLTHLEGELAETKITLKNVTDMLYAIKKSNTKE